MLISLNTDFSLWHRNDKKKAEKRKDVVRKIVSAFSRGNTRLQIGDYVTKAEKNVRLNQLVKKFNKV
jgi:hypothetical protein